VLARPKFAFPPDEITAVLTMFRSQGGELFQPDASATVSTDPTDTKFLQCARVSSAILQSRSRKVLYLMTSVLSL
jgi:hypothetical protein